MMRSWWLSPVRRSSSRAAQVRAGGTSACAQRLRVTARSHNIVRRTPAPVARAGAGKVSVGLGPGVAEQIAVFVGSRSVSQVRSHAQKYFLRLHRAAKAN